MRRRQFVQLAGLVIVPPFMQVSLAASTPAKAEEIEEMQKCLEKHDKKYCENEIAAKFLNRLIKEGIIY